MTEGEILEAFQRYDAPIALKDPSSVPSLPLADEPHIEAWQTYAEDASREGVVPALRRRLVQLHFPIAAGISKSDQYLAATRRGEFPADGFTPAFRGELTLRVEDTIAGNVPIIVAADRKDFESLVQIFGSRNEPEPVPESMGACIVTGLTDWDRVRVYREAWSATHDESDWPAEFSRFAARKELYQDRFIILSSGSYSGVETPEGFSTADWMKTSLQIRREHEATHYLTYRLTGSMRNHLLDELVADYIAIVRTAGAYRPDWALLFFGLENFPAYRPGGRMENYRGNPPFPDAAIPMVASVLHRAVQNLAAFDRVRRETLAEVVGRLARQTLSSIAERGV